MRFKIEFATIV